MTVAIRPQTRNAEFRTKHSISVEMPIEIQGRSMVLCIGDLAETKKAAAADTQYTCPMHPEIVRDEPGACPICRMAWSRLPSDELVN
jgi:Cu+-exporting ATPase